jgi:integrase
MTSPKHETSYTTGVKGKNRVRVFAHARRNGAFFLEYRDDDGRRRCQKLETTDWLEAKSIANRTAQALAQASPPLETLTVGRLFDNWLAEVTARKSAGMQRTERASLEVLRASFGAAAAVKRLDARDWETFVERRRAGTLRPAKSRVTRGVGNRQIAIDLKLLRAVIRRAMRLKTNGTRWLEFDPFDGCTVPVEANPKRPSLSGEDYGKLVAAAEVDHDPQVLLYLVLVHESGHRSGAVRLLRWRDIDLAKASVTWPAETDKKRRAHTVPLSPRALQALTAEAMTGGTAHEWLFRSPTNPAQPVSRLLVADWWRRLEKRAGLAHVKGRGWHSLRRKFATDLKHLPLSDLMALGNWRDGGTVVRSYMQADEATMRAALTGRAG